MLSRKILRDDPDRIRWAMEVKGIDDVDLDSILEIDERWRSLKTEGDELRRQRNEISKRIGGLKQAGDESGAEEAIQRSQRIKKQIETVETEATALREELDDLMLELPNIPAQESPIGADETDNVELRRVGFDSIPELPNPVIPHYDLGEKLDIIDEVRGAKTSGSGFYFLKGDGARLEHALIQFMLDVHRDQGYVDVFPPIPISSESMTGTGQLPKFAEDAYKIEDEDLWLCPTAEVPVTNMYANDILLREDLPIKHQAYTPNFRREAGEHGTKTRGIVRVHQFNKVEMVNFVEPSESEERLDELVAEAEVVLQKLGLPYRVIEMCTGDMGFAQTKKYDLEVWAPADDMPNGPSIGGRWLEVSSASNFGEFQARRAGLRYRPERHESTEYLHTLNASGTAIPRVMVAILEYYQTSEGVVEIPEPLRKYMNGQSIIEGHHPVGERAVGSGDR